MNKLILVCSCILAVVADMLMVWWAKNDAHPKWCAMAGILATFVGMLVWMYSMRVGIESATAITTYALFTVAGCTALGYFVFHEELSPLNWSGIFLAMISIILILL